MLKLLKSIAKYGYRSAYKLKAHYFSKRPDEVFPEGYFEIEDGANKNTFFGYYDIGPFNPADNNLLLVHLNNADPALSPSVSIATSLGVYDSAKKQMQIVGTTNTWNWQQGARLQWIDAGRLIYNLLDEKENKVVSNIYDLKTKQESKINSSISVVYKSQFGLTMSYSRLTKFSEYGYYGFTGNDDGIGVNQIDLNTGEVTSLFSFDDADALIKDGFKNKPHINHILVAPDASKFVFIYRFYDKQGKRRDVLLSYDFKTKQIKIVVDNSMISHYTWFDNDAIFVWGIIGGKPGYFKINIQTSAADCIIATPHDGHPSMLNSQTVITDTYSDWKVDQQRLLSINLKDGKQTEILRIGHPAKYSKDCRCDLHPSLSADKTLFQIDTRKHNFRRMGVGKVTITK